MPGVSRRIYEIPGVFHEVLGDCQTYWIYDITVDELCLTCLDIIEYGEWRLQITGHCIIRLYSNCNDVLI